MLVQHNTTKQHVGFFAENSEGAYFFNKGTAKLLFEKNI